MTESTTSSRQVSYRHLGRFTENRVVHCALILIYQTTCLMTWLHSRFRSISHIWQHPARAHVVWDNIVPVAYMFGKGWITCVLKPRITCRYPMVSCWGQQRSRKNKRTLLLILERGSSDNGRRPQPSPKATFSSRASWDALCLLLLKQIVKIYVERIGGIMLAYRCCRHWKYKSNRTSCQPWGDVLVKSAKEWNQRILES